MGLNLKVALECDCGENKTSGTFVLNGTVKTALESGHIDSEIARQLTNYAAGEIPPHLTFPTGGVEVKVYGASRNEFDLPSYVELTQDMIAARNENKTPNVVVVEYDPNKATEAAARSVSMEHVQKTIERLGGVFYPNLEAFNLAFKQP